MAGRLQQATPWSGRCGLERWSRAGHSHSLMAATRFVADSKFVVSRSDGPVPLQPVDAALDGVPGLVVLQVELRWTAAAGHDICHQPYTPAMPIQPRSAGSAEEQLSIIDALIALPFPEQEGQSRTQHGWGGPGYHIAVLRESRDFWDVPGPETITVAEEELEADLTSLVTVLAERWRSPSVVDLWPHLGLDNPDIEAPPEPLNSLCMLAVSMQMWQVPSTGRWLGLTIGQVDRELPFELLAAVGEFSTLPK